MNLSRKDFFKKGLLSLGEVAFKAGGLLSSVREAETFVEPGPPDAGGGKMVAAPRNERCLAGNCGCFCCVEKCTADAISLVPGIGISIDRNRCTGCSTCHYVCPVQPKAIGFVSKEDSSVQTA